MPNFANKSRLPPLDGTMLTAITRIGVVASATNASTTSGQKTSAVSKGSTIVGRSSAARAVVQQTLAIKTNSKRTAFVNFINSIIRTLVYTVSTIAGSNSASSVGDLGDGNSTSSKLNTPKGACFDSSGNFYFVEGNTNRIRKLTPSGQVTTLAGSGTAGSTNGTGTGASFNGLNQIVCDNDGNLFVTDYNNNRVRKITSSGVVTTFAGSGTASSTDGTGTGASFYGPYGIAIDSQNNLYVSDKLSSKIRKITPLGVVTTLALSAPIQSPQTIAIDSSKNLYVVQASPYVSIIKITESGTVSVLAGGASGYTDGVGLSANFVFGSSITYDPIRNTLYVFDYNVRKVTLDGIVTTVAGPASATTGYTDGLGVIARFAYAFGGATNSVGDIYVSDWQNNRIRKVTITEA